MYALTSHDCDDRIGVEVQPGDPAVDLFRGHERLRRTLPDIKED